MMIMDWSSITATVVGASLAPTVAALWAGYNANVNARLAAKLAVIAAEKVENVRDTLLASGDTTNAKLDTVHTLVNNQLSQAVERYNEAIAEVEELKKLLKKALDRKGGQANGW